MMPRWRRHLCKFFTKQCLNCNNWSLNLSSFKAPTVPNKHTLGLEIGFFPVEGVMMNNSLSSKGQLIPTCSDAIAARLLARFLLSLAVNVCRRRDWQPETRRGRKMAGVSSCLSSICKKSKFPIGDMIVIKTNRKKTDECINQSTAEHRWGAAVCGVVVGGPFQLHIEAPVWNLHELQLLTKRPWVDTKLRKIHRVSWPVEYLMKYMQTQSPADTGRPSGTAPTHNWSSILIADCKWAKGGLNPDIILYHIALKIAETGREQSTDKKNNINKLGKIRVFSLLYFHFITTDMWDVNATFLKSQAKSRSCLRIFH